MKLCKLAAATELIVQWPPKHSRLIPKTSQAMLSNVRGADSHTMSRLSSLPRLGTMVGTHCQLVHKSPLAFSACCMSLFLLDAFTPCSRVS